MQRELFSCRHHAPERFFIGLVGCGAGGAPIHHGADGDVKHLLGNVLVDDVVGEAGERVRGDINFHFGFVGFAEFHDALSDGL